jgi:hypothetical protein
MWKDNEMESEEHQKSFLHFWYFLNYVTKQLTYFCKQHTHSKLCDKHMFLPAILSE